MRLPLGCNTSGHPRPGISPILFTLVRAKVVQFLPPMQEDIVAAVKRFYAGFDDGTFPNAEEYTTHDWTHINPLGGMALGREAVLEEVRAAHSSFLKGVTDTPESFDVRRASDAVAIVVVPSRLSSFTTPDGASHDYQRNIRTFIVVNQNGRWLIRHDHNTFITSVP